MANYNKRHSLLLALWDRNRIIITDVTTNLTSHRKQKGAFIRTEKNSPESRPRIQTIVKNLEKQKLFVQLQAREKEEIKAIGKETEENQIEKKSKLTGW